MRRQCVSGESWDAFFGHDFPLRGRINDKIDFPLRGRIKVVPRVARRKIWSAVARAALCAGRGTAFARHPTTVIVHRVGEFFSPLSHHRTCRSAYGGST